LKKKVPCGEKNNVMRKGGIHWGGAPGKKERQKGMDTGRRELGAFLIA